MTTPSPSIFTNDEHSPVFKSVSVSSGKNLEISSSGGGSGKDLKSRSPIKIDLRAQQLNQHFSLRKKDKNNNQEKFRKPSSSTISSTGGQHGSSNEDSLFASNEHHPHSHHKSTALNSSYYKDNAMKLRSSVDRRLAQKRQSRVIKMLAILVVEFFVCWTPLHCINLISLYKPKIVYQFIGYNGLCLFFLLAYLSSCTNPITYCFMNSKFRQSFLSLFSCCSSKDVRTNTKQILKPKIRSTNIEEL